MKSTIIYKTTNLINGKEYVGQFTGSERSFKYYLGGGVLLMKAIKKYNKENFKKEIIVTGNFNLALTNELEKHYIQLYNTVRPHGYNITKCGKDAPLKDKPPASKETRLKISASLSKTVYQYDLKGNFIKEWQSTQQMCKELGFDNGSISKCCHFKIITYYNNIFVYNKNDVVLKLKQIEDSAQYTEYHCYYNDELYVFNSVPKLAKFIGYSLTHVRRTFNENKHQLGDYKIYKPHKKIE